MTNKIKNDVNELVVVRGLPGSGKSTFAKNNYKNHLIFEPDHIVHDINGNYLFDAQLWPHVTALVEKLVDYGLSLKKNVVVVDVFPRHEDYKVYKDLARYHGVNLKVETRNESYKNIHHVPNFVVNQMKEVWED